MGIIMQYHLLNKGLMRLSHHLHLDCHRDLLQVKLAMAVHKIFTPQALPHLLDFNSRCHRVLEAPHLARCLLGSLGMLPLHSNRDLLGIVEDGEGRSRRKDGIWKDHPLLSCSIQAGELQRRRVVDLVKNPGVHRGRQWVSASLYYRRLT
jgi:hypothetical protein